MNYRRFIRGRRFNFWVFADWADLGVTNQATFIAWVEANSDYAVDSVTDFSLVGTELKCNIAASGGSVCNMFSQGFTEVKAIGNGFEGLTELRLSNNSLAEFNPTLPLPNALTLLTIRGNNLTEFNPTLPLPSSLVDLFLRDNNISDWSLLEPWITAQPTFTDPCQIYTTGNPTSAIGTTFETIALTKNATIIE